MIKRMAHLIIVVTAIFAVMQCSCNMSDTSGPGGGADVRAGEVRYYSAADPGVWESRVEDHDADITVIRVNDTKVINVHVPFTNKREKKHYLEAIVLLDSNKKQLQKKSFEKGFGEEGAKFEVPADFNEQVYVVIKCNLHDMWEKPVDLSE